MPSRLLVRAFSVAVLAATLLWPSGTLAQRTSVARDFPIYDNGGKPDLAVDPQRFVGADGDRGPLSSTPATAPLPRASSAVPASAVFCDSTPC